MLIEIPKRSAKLSKNSKKARKMREISMKISTKTSKKNPGKSKENFSKENSPISLNITTVSKTGHNITDSIASKTPKSSESPGNREFLRTTAEIAPNLAYFPSILAKYRENEENFSPTDFLRNHAIEAPTRSKMVDWMIEVTSSFQCSEETLFLSTSLMDRFFGKSRNKTVEDLHLIGVTCIFIASKYEEVFPLKLDVICAKISHNKFSKQEIKTKECEILEALDFLVFGPNVCSFVGMIKLLISARKKSGVGEDFPTSLLGKALSYFAKMVLYDYSLVSRVSCRKLAMAVAYAALKLVESVCNGLNLQEIMEEIQREMDVRFSEISEIVNEIFLLTQRFDKTYGINNNLKRFSVDFFVEMNEKRKK